eukprot:2050418-Prymnesium_polylepis.2
MRRLRLARSVGGAGAKAAEGPTEASEDRAALPPTEVTVEVTRAAEPKPAARPQLHAGAVHRARRAFLQPSLPPTQPLPSPPQQHS